MFCLRLQILSLFYFLFLHGSVSTFAAQFDSVAAYSCRSFDNKPTIFSSKPRFFFLAFGRVEATVNVVIILIVLLNIVVYKLRLLRDENSGEKLNNSSPLPPEQLCRRFSLADILAATNNFDESLVIGKGGFGITYEGVIDNGTCRVAIKRLKPMSKQGAPEFWTEIRMLTKVQHCHVISLIGYCESWNEMIIVYEYMARGTFADHLYKRGGNGDNYYMPWFRRLEICIEAARGIDYLHTGTCDGIQHVIHRDLKSSNILLDDNWTAKISDFGYSTIGPINTTGNNGTAGYRDPSCKLSCKSDVYAFGVILFEALSGRRAVDIDFYMDQWLLAKWAKRCIKEGKVDEITDPDLRGEISQDCLSVFVQIANQCLDDEPEKRSSMAEVVIRLQYALGLQDKEDTNAGGEYKKSPEHAGSPIVEGENFDASGTYDGQEQHEDSSIVEGNIFNSRGSYRTEIEVSSTSEEISNAGGTCENQELEGSSIGDEEISNASGTCENQKLEGSSMVEEEMSNASGTCENQKLEGSSIVEEEISNAGGTYDNQEEVLNANNGVHQVEKIEGNGRQSPTKAMRMKFTEKARIFLFGSRDR